MSNESTKGRMDTGDLIRNGIVAAHLHAKNLYLGQ